jgi:hypothetical protein
MPLSTIILTFVAVITYDFLQLCLQTFATYVQGKTINVRHLQLVTSVDGVRHAAHTIATNPFNNRTITEFQRRYRGEISYWMNLQVDNCHEITT